MNFFRQDYWCRLPLPPPGDRPNLGIELPSPASQADSLAEPSGKSMVTHTVNTRVPSAPLMGLATAPIIDATAFSLISQGTEFQAMSLLFLTSLEAKLSDPTLPSFVSWPLLPHQDKHNEYLLK